MAMTWTDLAFLHWRVDAELLRAHLPRGLVLDTFEGEAWLGVVPFLMTGVRARMAPPLPFVSEFLELNVRTYVVSEEKPGVWFFSLDAASRLAVRTARRVFHLPYFDARMSLEREGPAIGYRSVRTHRGAPKARFHATYQASERASRTPLERWLTERYCLYAQGADGRLFRGDIHHEPWPLRTGTARLEELDMTRLVGLALPDEGPLVHFAERIDVVGWLPRPVLA
jgi:uncharacterized protein YqjF (DUF2071 family)